MCWCSTMPLPKDSGIACWLSVVPGAPVLELQGEPL